MLVPVLAVATAATVATGLSPAAAQSNPNPTVTIGGDPQGVAADPDGKHVYVASYADNAVHVIDTATKKVSGSIAVGAGPRGVAVDPDSRHAFVTNFAESSVSVIDTASGKLIRNVPVGTNPASVAVFPRDHYAIVTNYYANTVSVIDSKTLEVTGGLPVGAKPDGVAIDPRGEFAYVANSGSNNVSVIDIHNRKVVATILAGRAPQKVAIDPDGRHAYVTNFGDHTVSVIDLPIQLGADLLNPILEPSSIIRVGINPRGLAVDGSSHRAFVVNVGEDTMSVIDTEKGTVIDTKFVGFSPDDVAVGPDSTAYITARGDGTVTVIRRPS
ncbi:MAG TPA: YncE family protein [Pseudonocardiaceae bacterium]|jgi:YVTN family beta-propeller protein|nr:YncE family protein [Pseudonocardiaceae bacterium]